MKPYLFLFLLPFLVFSCGDDDDNVSCELTPDQKAVALLFQIDYETLALEGGFRFEQSDVLADLTIDPFPAEFIYNPPGDFGDMTIMTLSGTSRRDTVFSGTIVWSGTGDRQFPDLLLPPADFPTDTNIQPLDGFEIKDIGPNGNPDSINPADLFTVVEDLEVVQEALELPSTRLGWFFYPRGVGVGDPVTWDYYILILREPIFCEG